MTANTPTPEAPSPQPPANDKEQAKEERTFTQADLDRILAARLAKYSDYDTIKGELDALKRSQLSEQERAVQESRDETRREVIREMASRFVNSEARNIATEMGFHNVDDVSRYISQSDVSVSDAGEVDIKALREMIDAAVKDRPYLLKKAEKPAPPSPSDVGLGGSGPQPGKTPADAFAGMFEVTK